MQAQAIAQHLATTSLQVACNLSSMAVTPTISSELPVLRTRSDLNDLRTCSSQKGGLSIRAATSASAASLSSRRGTQELPSSLEFRRVLHGGLGFGVVGLPGLEFLICEEPPRQDAQLVITGPTCRLQGRASRAPACGGPASRTFADAPPSACEHHECRLHDWLPLNNHVQLTPAAGYRKVRHAQTSRRSSGKDLGSLASCCLALQEI